MPATAARSLPSFPVPSRRPQRSGSPVRIAVTQVTDPLCPRAYSYEPVLRALEARYGDQLVFRTVLIGLVSTVEESLARGSSAEGRALTAPRFRRYGMPITPHPAAIALGRTANSDGAERHTAPTLILTAEEGRAGVVPGFQPFEAADVAPMNLEPRLRRLPPPALEDLLAAYPAGLTSQEVARVLADTTATVDRAGAEQTLTGVVAAGRAGRFALGDDALWTAA